MGARKDFWMVISIIMLFNTGIMVISTVEGQLSTSRSHGVVSISKLIL